MWPNENEKLQYPYCYVPIIRKNTSIPVTKSEVFYTAFDGQQMVDVTVYQGEDPDALNNTEIGRFLVTGLRNVPSGNPVVATFALDLNGILHVTAQEKETGLEKSVTIDNAISRFEAEAMDQARERIETLFADDAEAIPALPREIVQARALVEKAERLMEGASADDREDLVDLVEAVNDGISGQRPDELHETVEKLSDLIYYLES